MVMFEGKRDGKGVGDVECGAGERDGKGRRGYEERREERRERQERKGRRGKKGRGDVDIDMNVIGPAGGIYFLLITSLSSQDLSCISLQELGHHFAFILYIQLASPA
jgi:hypothetical protein